MTYRSKTDIIAVILKTASSNGGALKAKIMYEGFLTWAQVQEYLSLLLKNDLIKYQERARTFIITDKGIRLLNIHNELNKLMTAKQIENKTAQTSAQTAPNNEDHDIGPPQDVTIPLDSEERATILSDAIHNNLHSTPLPSSGKPIQGPMPRTQTSP
jgi:predicted transcriptional regulator